MSTPLADAEVTQDIPEVRRFVVRGEDSLACRLADELLNRHRGRVTVVVSSRNVGYGPRIAKLAGVELIEADLVDGDVLEAADLATADALALLERDDVSNMDAAMRAHEMNPGLRVVVRMFNTSLGEGLAQLPYCTVLSEVALAAPAFVAAALGERNVGVHVRGSTLDVLARGDASAEEVLCGLAIIAGADEPELLPADQGAADLVLVHARRPTNSRSARPRRRSASYPIRFVLARIWRRVRFILGIFAALLIASAVVLANVTDDITVWEAVYVSMLHAFGGADANLDASTSEQIIDTVLGFASIALIPALTASVVDAVIKSRLELRDGTLVRRAVDHVVVVGLGGVGSHVLRLLHDEGIDAIGIDSSPAAPGVQVARNLDIPVVIGDASRRETLIAASVPTCRTLMALTSDDATNLQSALIARAVFRDVPAVLRLFDGDFAERVQHTFNLTVSRSVSYLAAPTFAARMLGQGLDTIAVGRHVLLAASLTVGANSMVEGDTVGDLRRPHESWIVELTNPGGQRFAAVAAAGRRLQRGDTLLVVATRRGLARLIADTAVPADANRRKPIVLHDASPYDSSPPGPRREKA